MAKRRNIRVTYMDTRGNIGKVNRFSSFEAAKKALTLNHPEIEFIPVDDSLVLGVLDFYNPACYEIEEVEE